MPLKRYLQRLTESQKTKEPSQKRSHSGTQTTSHDKPSRTNRLNGTESLLKSTESESRDSNLSRVFEILESSKVPLTESPQLRTIITVTAGVLIGIAYAVKEIAELFQ